MEAQMAVKDVFDPDWLLNPAKVFPLTVSVPGGGRREGEYARPRFGPKKMIVRGRCSEAELALRPCVIAVRCA